MPDDPFPPATIETPTLVGVANLQYVLTDTQSGMDSMTYHAELVWSDGTRTQKHGDVVPHLTSQQISGLQSVMAQLRTKAEAAWGSA